MADIINLRQYRKSKVRARKEERANANRALFGQTKQEKAAQDDVRRRLNDHLDGHNKAGRDGIPASPSGGTSHTPDEPPSDERT